MAEALPATPPAQPAPPPVAPVGSGTATATIPPGTSAAVSAPLFGGLRGGRKRKDGLPPGSPEAIEADRKKDALRKAKQRAAQQRPDPAPLPVAGAAPAPGGALAPDGALLGVEGQAIPWEPKMLQPLLKQLVPAIEELTNNKIVAKAELCRIPPDLVKEIKADAKWPDTAKEILELSGAQVGAKWLTKFGVSSENQAEITLGTAIVFLVSNNLLLMRRLTALAAAVNTPVKQPGQSQPAAQPAKV